MTSSLLKKRHSFLLLILLLLFLLASAGTVFGSNAARGGAAGGPITLAAEVGFEGFYRPGAWTPVRVEIANSGPTVSGQVEVEVRYNTTTRLATYAQEVSLPNTSRKTLTLYVHMEANSRLVNVRFVPARGTSILIHAPTNEIDYRAHIAGVMAGSSSPFNLLSVAAPGTNNVTTRIAPANLPGLPAGLDALNELVISNVDTGGLTNAQRQALAQWVASGGQLLVCGGPEWRKTAAGLGDLLPVQVQDTVTVSALEGLSRLGENADPLSGEMIVARSTPLEGAQVLARSGDIPLVVSRPSGHGRVVFLAFDPSLEPLAAWNGRTSLYRLLLSNGVPRPAWTFNDFPYQPYAYEGVSYIPNQSLPNPLVVTGFLVGYVVVVAPLNFTLVKKIKRRELAWVTIPLVVAVFCAAAFGLGILGLGSDPILNQWYVMHSSVEIGSDLGPGTGSVYGMLGLYSPDRRVYTLQADAPFLLNPYNPNTNQSDSDQMFFTQPSGGGSQNHKLQLDMSGLTAIQVRGQAPAPRIDSRLETVIKGSKLTLSGTVRNSSSLMLKDALLITPCQTHYLGDLPPANFVSVNDDCVPSEFSDQQDFHGYVELQNGPYPNSGPFSSQNASMNDKDWMVKALTGSLGVPGRSGLQVAGSAGGIYLQGWSDRPLAGIHLSRATKGRVTTLYLIRLDSPVRLEASGPVEISPQLFTYRVIDRAPASAYMGNIWGADIQPGMMLALSYTPVYPLVFQSVQGLTLTAENLKGVAPGVHLSAWDFSKQAWGEMKVDLNGQVQVEQPERFVGPLGEVRVRIENDGPDRPTFQGVQIRLTVQP